MLVRQCSLLHIMANPVHILNFDNLITVAWQFMNLMSQRMHGIDNIMYEIIMYFQCLVLF